MRFIKLTQATAMVEGLVGDRVLYLDAKRIIGLTMGDWEAEEMTELLVDGLSSPEIYVKDPIPMVLRMLAAEDPLAKAGEWLAARSEKVMEAPAKKARGKGKECSCPDPVTVPSHECAEHGEMSVLPNEKPAEVKP